MPQARVSAKHYGALWRAIALALDDEFFGQDSRRMKVRELCHAVPLGLGLQDLGAGVGSQPAFLCADPGRYLRQPSSGTAKEARIVLHERAAGASGGVFAHELLLMLLYGVSCWLVGRRIPILRTEFSYAEPAHSAEYRLMYCADLRFNRPNTLLAFEASYLDLPVVQNERSVKEFLRTAPESILLKYKNGSSLTARVRRRLRQFLPGEVPDFEELAR